MFTSKFRACNIRNSCAQSWKRPSLEMRWPNSKLKIFKPFQLKGSMYCFLVGCGSPQLNLRMFRMLMYDSAAEYFLGSIQPQKIKAEEGGPGHPVTVKTILLGPLRLQAHLGSQEVDMVLSCGRKDNLQRNVCSVQSGEKTYKQTKKFSWFWMSIFFGWKIQNSKLCEITVLLFFRALTSISNYILTSMII